MNKITIGGVLLAVTVLLSSACSSGGSGDSNSGASGLVITSVTPTANAKGVSFNTPISAIFSTPMTTSSISGATFMLSTAATGAVAGTVTYDVAARKAVFSPTASGKLDSATTYTATITTGAKDSAGTALANDYAWSFKTTHLDEYVFNNGKGKIATNIGLGTTTQDIAYAVAIQSDGKIVIAGDATESGDTPRHAIARYTTAGVLDTTFNATGVVWAPHVGTNSWDLVRAVVIDYNDNDKIVVAGSTNAGLGDNNTFLARYHSNGTLDTTFGIGGKVQDDLSLGTGTHDDSAYAMLTLPTGKYIVAGTTACDTGDCLLITRYTTTGALDTSFGTNGITATPSTIGATGIRSIARDINGRIFAAATTGAELVGNVGSHIVVVCYTQDGHVDTTFGTTGYRLTNLSSYGDSAQAIAVQTDGKILVAGWVDHDSVLLRYTTAGSLDSTFGSAGRVITHMASGENRALALALQADGKIVVVGTAPNPADNSDDVFAVMRYTSAGALDAAFENEGVALLNFTAPNDGIDAAHAVAIDSVSGKIVVAGEAGGDFGVARFVK